MPRFRVVPMRWKAHVLAYAGGLILCVAGSAGNAATQLRVAEMVDRWLDEDSFFVLKAGLDGVRVVLAAIAALGGTSVLIGGYLAEKRRPRFVCSTFISIGAGLALIGFVVQLGAAIVGKGSTLGYVASIVTTVTGVGSLLALLAQVRLLQDVRLPRLRRR